jgi:hypothetical protein
MGLILQLVVMFTTLLAVVAMLGGWIAWRTARLAGRGVHAARRIPGVRQVPLLGVPPPAPPADADLMAYPERLAALEGRLAERHDAVQAQLQVLNGRVLELGAKPDRADLLARYEVDIGHLDRRASSMRRVITLVWRTRAILLLRVHLAVTGRRRPTLKELPRTGDGGRPPRAELARARAAYAQAAGEVRTYVEGVRERIEALSSVIPPAPTAAERDADTNRALAHEEQRVEEAHDDLAKRMDRLADNLTWLGDHAGTLEVVDDDLAAPAGVAHGASAAHLLGEVSAAIARLNELAGAVDHQIVGRAMEQLQDDVGRLETEGLEEQAAAAAEIEVARLVEGFTA